MDGAIKIIELLTAIVSLATAIAASAPAMLGLAREKRKGRHRRKR